MGLCGTITLLDTLGGKSMNNLVKEKLSMFVHLKKLKMS